MKKILTIALVLVLSISAVFAKTAPKSKIAVSVVPYSFEFATTTIGNRVSKPLASVGYSVETMRNIYRYWALGLDVTSAHLDFMKTALVCTYDTFVTLNSYVTVPLGDWVTYRFGFGPSLNLEMINDKDQLLEAYLGLGFKTGFDFKFSNTFGATVACDAKITFQGNNAICLFVMPSTGVTITL